MLDELRPEPTLQIEAGLEAEPEAESEGEPACSFDYSIVRVVPRVERGEFINVGVIVFCSQRSFLAARIELDRERLQVLSPGVDAELIEEHLSLIPKVCAGGRAAGPVGALRQRERFHWLVAPRSTVVQLAPVHCGLCAPDETLDEVLERLLDRMVRPPL